MFASASRHSAVKALYTNVLKEAEKSAKTGALVTFLQSEYHDAAEGSLKAKPDSSKSSYAPFGGSQKTSEQLRHQTLENLNTFLTHKALHSELLQRYNPTVGMSEEERVRLTARRVGLDVPLTHNAGATDASPNSYRESAQIAQDQYKQDKDNKEDQLYSGKGDGFNVGGPLRPPVPKE
ncbi:hypothetical protein BCV70DRAFT_212453 [Testicularia cyperi]|uniref:Uncharacterized protein n=1 Tax=Testicularia cyperi TaxID=1882483 RepID=A0A317XLY5_9BASI|nr:hypothetical protein BCV70DRAFT_212453 [Testicularia cyperi]